MPRRVREDEDELLAAEQAIAMARELTRIADAGPDGHVLAVTEMAVPGRGRRLTEERLRDLFNAQTKALEKSGARLCRPCGGQRRSHGRADRRLVTVAGEATLRRAHFTCRRPGIEGADQATVLADRARWIW